MTLFIHNLFWNCGMYHWNGYSCVVNSYRNCSHWKYSNNNTYIYVMHKVYFLENLYVNKRYSLIWTSCKLGIILDLYGLKLNLSDTFSVYLQCCVSSKFVSLALKYVDLRTRLYHYALILWVSCKNAHKMIRSTCLDRQTDKKMSSSKAFFTYTHLEHLIKQFRFCYKVRERAMIAQSV
jgi:hypothetical protein